MDITSEQKARITTLLDWYNKEINEMFDLESLIAEGKYFSAYSPEYQDDITTLTDKLLKSFDSDFINKAIADFYFNPGHVDLNKGNSLQAQDKLEYDIFYTANMINKRWIEDNGDAYAALLVAKRLKNMLSNIYAKSETGHQYQNPDDADRLFFIPQPNDCKEILVKLKDIPEILPYIEELVSGKWNISFDIKNPGQYTARNTYELFHVYSAIQDLFEPLYRAGKFDYSLFKLTCEISSNVVDDYTLYKDNNIKDDSVTEDRVDFVRTYNEYNQRFIWEITEDISDNYHRFYNHIEYGHTRGSRWIIKALKHIERYQLAFIPASAYDCKTIEEKVISMMARSHGLLSVEDEDQFIDDLKQFDKESLLTLLPLAYMLQPQVLKALDWANLIPLRDLILEMSSHNGDFENSASITNGVVNRNKILKVLDLAGDKDAKKLITLFKKAKLGITKTATLIQAVKGWNEKALLKSINKHGQIALKAYGLLPITNGNDELLERYLNFKKATKESSRYGQEREENTRAAVQVGITNLAYNAGYKDPVRFEWAMEAQLATDAIPKGRQSIDQWEIELSMQGAEPQVVIFKADKLLKSVPPAVRKTDTYKSLKEWQKQLKAQATRFRKTLEKMMVSCDELSFDDLQNLSKLEVVSDLLSKLVLVDRDKNYGLFNPNDCSLTSIDGNKINITSPVRVAHSINLFNDGNLSDWQRKVVNLHIVQPFKQVYRELYVVTPAEERTGTYSNRFAGHVVSGSKASRLFQSRNWSMSSSDCAEVYKFDTKEKILVQIDFPDAGHYLAENEVITTDQIYFVKNHERLNMNDVPDILFSETMRDCDLVVSVAFTDDENELMTIESMKVRADLIGLLLEDIKLKNVRVEDHFAYVEGKLAKYRVHMGSGVIHIEPGNYLCIVPSSSVNQKNDLFLPFADKEPKVSEIISKIIMLTNDSKIKDTSILEQIKSSS